MVKVKKCLSINDNIKRCLGIVHNSLIDACFPIPKYVHSIS